MKRLSVLSLGVLLTLNSTWAMASEAKRIHFKKGATATDVQGRLKGLGQQVCYILRARKHQHMTLHVDAEGGIRGEVLFPSGESRGQPGSDFFDEDLLETGNYRICVEESLMGDPWSGPFTLTLKIR